MAIDAQVLEKRDEILRLAEHYGATDVRLVGQAARGEANGDSDVEVLVNLGPPRTLLDQGGLLMGLRELLGRTVWVYTEGGLKGRDRERYLAEAVPL